MKLPDGFTVRLGRRTYEADQGSTLVGGVPTRVLYLTALAKSLLSGGRIVVSSKVTAELAERLLDAGMANPVLSELPDVVRALTVVVPARDRIDALARLLKSIPKGTPIVVVDDCSRDADAVRRITELAGARLVVLPRNLGPAGARNAGLAEVTTPFVAFVDSDMVLGTDTLPMLLRHFADPRVGLVAPRVSGLETEGIPNWITRYEAARSSLDLGDEPANVRPGARVSWLPAACLVARREAISSGFTSDMRVAEDVDLVWRLVEAGWRVRYEPAVEAQHEHRSNMRDWLERKAFYGTGADILAARHVDSAAPAVFTPWTVVLLGALLAQRSWSLPIAVCTVAVAATRIGLRLRSTPDRARIAVLLTALGAVAATAQAAQLLNRHWWPAAVIGSILSKRVRRATFMAAFADAIYEHRRTDSGMGLVEFGIARRLDDLAYGAGLWWGALKGHSFRALKPVVRRRFFKRR